MADDAWDVQATRKHELVRGSGSLMGANLPVKGTSRLDLHRVV